MRDADRPGAVCGERDRRAPAAATDDDGESASDPARAADHHRRPARERRPGFRRPMPRGYASRGPWPSATTPDHPGGLPPGAAFTCVAASLLVAARCARVRAASVRPGAAVPGSGDRVADGCRRQGRARADRRAQPRSHNHRGSINVVARRLGAAPCSVRDGGGVPDPAVGATCDAGIVAPARRRRSRATVGLGRGRECVPRHRRRAAPCDGRRAGPACGGDLARALRMGDCRWRARTSIGSTASDCSPHCRRRTSSHSLC